MADEEAPLVLYVEDDAAVRDIGQCALEDGGFAVEPVASGAEALEQIEKPGAVWRVLVTDIDLAGGIDGWEVARQARELLPHLPVIYVSGGSAHDWASKGVPGSIMLSKPFAIAQLVTAVANASLGPQDDMPTND